MTSFDNVQCTIKAPWHLYTCLSVQSVFGENESNVCLSGLSVILVRTQSVDVLECHGDIKIMNNIPGQKGGKDTEQAL